MYTFLLLFLSIVFIIVATTRFKLHPFLALLSATFLFGICSGMNLNDLVNAINEGFGGTIGKIGIIIIAGLIIGTFLEKSGGAYALAQVVLRIIGPKRVHAAMALIGYVVSIPVFADSGFIIMSPLNKALTKKAGLSLAGTAIALSLGLIATHTMVPPTPGPIAAAAILDADLGKVILYGLLTSSISLVACIIYAKRVGERIYIDPQPELSNSELETKVANAPAAWKSFLPILLPIMLIILKSIADYPSKPFGAGELANVIGYIGNPVIALIIGMGCAFLLPKKLDSSMFSAAGWVGEALKSGALIILITGAGGAFGKVLQQADIGAIIEANIEGINIGIWLPFLVAAAIKTAQGSSTVALITTASILAPLMPSLGLDTDVSKALTVIAIGAGSAVVSHANDSFFWVVTQLSNMDVEQGYKLHSVGTAILGVTAILVLTILSFVL